MSEEIPEMEKRGLPRLLWGMIGRPRATLEYLNERGGRTWWLPALLVVLLTLLPIVVGAPLTIQEAREAILASQEQMEEQWDQANLPPEQQEQMKKVMDFTIPLTTVVAPAVLGVVGSAVVWLAWAGALYLAGLVVGGHTTFSQMFRMVVWTWLPYALRGLLQSVYILASGQLITNPGLSGLVKDSRPISEVIAAPPSPGQTLLVGFLSRIDLFLAWNLILIVIGVMVTARLPRRKAVLVTLGVWVLLTAVSLIPSLVSGLVAQQFMGSGGL